MIGKDGRTLGRLFGPRSDFAGAEALGKGRLWHRVESKGHITSVCVCGVCGGRRGVNHTRLMGVARSTWSPVV